MEEVTMLQVLSLGAGVQSSVVLLMSHKGVLPKLDAAIFADTQWEPKAVYEHLKWLAGVDWETWEPSSGVKRWRAIPGIYNGGEAAMPVYVVTAGDLREHATIGRLMPDGRRHWLNIPLYIEGAKSDGSRGIVRKRECTRDYKIRPIERCIRTMLGLKKGQRWPTEAVVEQWFGISADETQRMRTPKRAATTYRYPLVFDLGMRRSDCIAWAARHYPGRTFPRSACIGCPYHQNDEWHKVRTDPEEWADAVAADEAIRHRPKRRGTGYMHLSYVPLTIADLSFDPPAPDEPRLFRHECMGMCGV